MQEGKFTPEVARGSELEKQLSLREQYEAQRRVLSNVGILEPLSSGELGIIDLEGTERPIPSYESVVATLEAKQEQYLLKAEQGFTRLQLVPFGLPIAELVHRYEAALERHATARQLLSPDGTLLELNVTQPVYALETLRDGDQTDQLVYDVQSFDDDHGGVTKQQLLQSNDPWAGWQVELLEDNSIIPRAGTNEVHGPEDNQRARLEAGQSPNSYLNTLRDSSQYQHETGLTPESWLTLALAELDTHNRVVDDYDNPQSGSLCFLLGSYVLADRYVPYALWNRGFRQADLDGSDPGFRREYYGVRSRVRVEPTP